jgi:hypothetical protein
VEVIQEEEDGFESSSFISSDNGTPNDILRRIVREAKKTNFKQF